MIRALTGSKGDDWKESAALGRVRAALRGPPGSGRTSLLFNYALTCAKSGGVAYFLASRSKLEAAPPLRVGTAASGAPGTGARGEAGYHDAGRRDEVDSDDDGGGHSGMGAGGAGEGVPVEVLDRVYIKYIESDLELRRFFSNTHVLSPVPDLFVIDDLDVFLSCVIVLSATDSPLLALTRTRGGRSSSATASDLGSVVERTLAIMADGASFCWNKLDGDESRPTGSTPLHVSFPSMGQPQRDPPRGSDGCPCVHLLVGLSTEPPPVGVARVLYRWFPTWLDITTSSSGDPSSMVSPTSSPRRPDTCMIAITGEPRREDEGGSSSSHAIAASTRRKYRIDPGMIRVCPS